MSLATATTSRWRIGSPVLWWAGTGLLLVLAGLVAGQPLLSALGTPLTLGVSWNWAQRPMGAVEVSIEDAGYVAESHRVEATLVIAPTAGVAMTRLKVGSHDHRPVEALVASDSERRIGLSVSGVRTGRRQAFAAAVSSSGPDQVVWSQAVELGPVEVTVLPRTHRLRMAPLPFRLQGLTGAHESRRIGEGGEFHDISLFTPGDRLRRIDWRVTTRRSGQSEAPGGVTELYVRRTHATADASVVVALDSRDEVGPDVAAWVSGQPVHPDDPTSLDIAREAAGSLARHFIEIGDRVGVVDLARTWRPVRPAGGRRHLQRILHQLADAYPNAARHRRVRAPHLPSGSMVVIFSAFLDDEAVDLAGMWRLSGHRVLAVDVVPAPDLVGLRVVEEVAHRLIALDRQDRLDRMEQAGVEVIPWHHDGAGRPTLVPGLAASARRRGRRR